MTDAAQPGRITAAICTYQRYDLLPSAIESALTQTLPDGSFEVIVIDNSPDADRSALEAQAFAGRPNLIWRHEARPGLSNARNVAAQLARSPLIAFLDDDESAAPGWLAALLKARDETGADAVFGPITGRAPDAAPWLKPWLERFFGREGPARTGVIDQPFGCGNSLMVRATALPGPAPFDAGTDQAGGEDDALFAALAARGGRFGWAADAWVEEFAPAHRATLNYALARAFAYGQGPSQTAAAARNWPGVARWMAIGAAQTAVWGAASAVLTLIASPKRAEMYDRTARGVGKLFWMKGFEPRFYGAQELARLDRAAAPS